MFCIISHADVFNTILRGRSPSLDLPAMRELALTTAVIARANCQGEVLVFRPGSYFIVIGFVSPFFFFYPLHPAVYGLDKTLWCLCGSKWACTCCQIIAVLGCSCHL